MPPKATIANHMASTGRKHDAHDRREKRHDPDIRLQISQRKAELRERQPVRVLACRSGRSISICHRHRVRTVSRTFAQF